jgi:heme-degrading monooxygenase HmoA
VTAVEGDPPKRVVIQVWDSLEKMQAWRNGADYTAARKIGDKYAAFRSYAVDGLAP